MKTAPANRTLIVVSGAPGSGKTTLARNLAQALGFPLISKDVIKEALYDALPGRHTSSELSVAAMEVLWALAGQSPQAVLEANFDPKPARERLRALEARTLEIHCVCPLDLCAERYNRRSASPKHHPVHPKTISMESLAKYADAIGAGPVIEVDTREPVEPREVMARIREHWPDVQTLD